MRRPVCIALASLALILPACSPAGGVEAGPLTLSPVPPGAPMRAGYVVLVNHDDRPRTLISASSPAYDAVEFHRTTTDGTVSRMRREATVQIAAGAELRFEPGGRHLMLMQPTGAGGNRISVEFCFQDGECILAHGDAGSND